VELTRGCPLARVNQTCHRGKGASHMKCTVVVTALSVVLLGTSGLHAQASYKRDLPDALAKRAKITEQAAAATAQKRVPTGTIQGVELEQEKGRLIYSYDMKVPGKSGVEEVNIDAMDGKVVAVE